MNLNSIGLRNGNSSIGRKCIATATLILHFCVGSVLGDEISMRPQYDLVLDSSGRATITLALSTNVLQVGELYSADYLFINNGSAVTVFNPFLNSLNELPLMLVVFTTDGKIRASFWLPFYFRHGSRTDEARWVSVPRGGRIGARMEFRLDSGWRLESGDYFFQFICLKGFIDTPSITRDGRANLYDEKTFDRRELFRSNLVKVRIVSVDASAKSTPVDNEPE